MISDLAHMLLPAVVRQLLLAGIAALPLPALSRFIHKDNSHDVFSGWKRQPETSVSSSHIVPVSSPDLL